MLVVFGIIAIIFFVNFLTPGESKKKLTVIVASFLFILMSALRSAYFAPDTLRYVTKYLSLPGESVSYYWNMFIHNEGKDPLFYVFSKFVSSAGLSYQVWLTMIAVLFCVSAASLMLKYAEDAFLGYIGFISLGYLYFSFTGLRQTMAMAIVWFSYKHIVERKFWRFAALVIIATMFHSSAIIFFIAYPMANFKVGWKQITGIVAALIVSYFFSGQVKYLITVIGWTDEIAAYGSEKRKITMTLAGFIILALMYAFCTFYKERVLEKDERNLTLYNMFFIGVCFQAFAMIVAELFRISLYFNIFGIILVTKAVLAEKDEQFRVFIYAAVLTAYIAYIVYDSRFSGFAFFWQ